jgi:hypothetical protein
MKLKEFVNSQGETVEAGDTLQRAAEKMKDNDLKNMAADLAGLIPGPVGISCGGASLFAVPRQKHVAAKYGHPGIYWQLAACSTKLPSRWSMPLGKLGSLRSE